VAILRICRAGDRGLCPGGSDAEVAQQDRSGVPDLPSALAEYRYWAVREVLGGSPIGEVAERFGTTRQSLHAWRNPWPLTSRPPRSSGAPACTL
jgi:hypothetical protein